MTGKYALGINLVGGFEKQTPEERIALLKRVGWDGFFTGWRRGETAEFVRAADRFGLLYQSIHAPFDRVETMWSEGDEGRAFGQLLIDCVNDCADHGIATMVIHPFKGFRDHTPTKVGLENYARVVEAADRRGVRLGFENVEGEEYLAALMEAFWNAPSCGFCLDTGHELCYNGGKDMLALYGEKLCHTHFNDNFGVYRSNKTWQNDFHLVMGDGLVDWRDVMDRIDASGYSGMLTCELKLSNPPDLRTHEGYAAMGAEGFYRFALERMRGVVDRTLQSTPIEVVEI